MNRHVKNISAVFLKDLRQLWPMAMLSVALILAKTLFDFQNAPAMVRGLLLPLAPPLVSSLFLIVLIHKDAAASLRHEWLTRPIGGLDVLAAKFLLIVAAILLPLTIGPTISDVRNGIPGAEAVLLAISELGPFVAVGFALLIVAAMTSTLIETGGLMIGLFLLFLFSTEFLPLFKGGVGFILGANWIFQGAVYLVTFIGGIVVLWLQYAARRTIATRVALGVMIGFHAITLLLLSRDNILALQRNVTGHHPAADSFNVALMPECLDPRRVDQPMIVGANGQQANLPERVHAIAFSTITRAEGVPEGWRMLMGQVRGTIVDSRGAALESLEPFRRFPGEPVPERKVNAPNTSQNTWTIDRAKFDDMSRQDAGLRLDYDVNLLEPVHTAEIAADGERHSLPGIGTCMASATSPNAIQVHCFKAGHQPDMLSARLANESSVSGAMAERGISFAPDLLQFSPGESRNITLRLAATAEQPRVTISAYEARAILTRSVTAPGMLGGASCVPSGQP